MSFDGSEFGGSAGVARRRPRRRVALSKEQRDDDPRRRVPAELTASFASGGVASEPQSPDVRCVRLQVESARRRSSPSRACGACASGSSSATATSRPRRGGRTIGTSPLVLDAGCGAAMSALELFAMRSRVCDTSASTSPRRSMWRPTRFAERGLPAGFMQADIMQLPLEPESVDVIFSEGVLHHTDSTRDALLALASLLRPGGRFLFYVYRRKGPIREFTDDYVRAQLQGMPPADGLAGARPVSRVWAKRLGALTSRSTSRRTSSCSGFPPVPIDIQRFFYWHVFKAYHRPDATFEEMNHINFDWYAPANAHRQSPEEVRAWCAEAGLEIERENVQEAGITVVARKRGSLTLMCGIAGVLDLAGGPVSSVHRPRDDRRDRAIAAPTARAASCDGPLGLGHRRLAIIDLIRAGHQPMATPDGRYVLTYNGEVYNFRELRAELEARGRTLPLAHRHRGRAARARAVGRDALPRFNGMFAFALWDASDASCCWRATATGSSRCTTPARARHVAVRLGDQGAARAPGAIAPSSIDEALLEYFTFQNFFTDRTLFRGRQAAAGRHVDAHAVGERRRPQPARYWDFDFRGARQARTLDARSTSRSSTGCFRQAVSRQLVADVPVGSYLSGGMDSGSITARRAPRDRTACAPSPSASTCTRRRASSSPSTSASAPSTCPTCFKTEHYEMVLKAGDMERAMPRAGLASRGAARRPELPELLRRAARQRSSCKVVLSGAGGDELFGGYPWRYYRAVVNDDFEHYVDKYYGFWQRLIPETDDRARASRRSRRRSPDVSPRDIFRDVFATTRPSCRAPGGLHQPLALLRGQDVPARPAGRRGQAVDGAQPRDARAVSRQRPRRLRPAPARSTEARQPAARSCASTRTSPGAKTERFFERTPRRQAAPAQGDGALRPRPRSRTPRSRASPRPTRAGSAARASTTSGDACSPRRAHLRVSRPRHRARARRRAPRRPRQPPPADLVAALARAVVPDVPAGRPVAGP